MAREVYCRRKTCAYHASYTTGDEPRICPGCKLEARWSTMPRQETSESTLAFNDRRYLRKLKIDDGEQEP